MGTPNYCHLPLLLLPASVYRGENAGSGISFFPSIFLSQPVLKKCQVVEDKGRLREAAL